MQLRKSSGKCQKNYKALYLMTFAVDKAYTGLKVTRVPYSSEMGRQGSM